jgi:hypothetical protein
MLRADRRIGVLYLIRQFPGRTFIFTAQLSRLSWMPLVPDQAEPRYGALSDTVVELLMVLLSWFVRDEERFEGGLNFKGAGFSIGRRAATRQTGLCVDAPAM